MTTQQIVPTHIAIVMDGNGRWAKERGKPRLEGHSEGVKSLRRCVEASANLGVRYLTVFAFSSENWRRPAEEVQGIMRLFIEAIRTQVTDLNKNNIELRFIGDEENLSQDVILSMREAEGADIISPRLTLIVAMNYGGRWDILQAVKQLQAKEAPLTEEAVNLALTTARYAPEPDLIIRTGGELRISNFLLWQAAYAELYFTPKLWPEFDEKDLQNAINDYTQRERRFGALIEE